MNTQRSRETGCGKISHLKKKLKSKIKLKTPNWLKTKHLEPSILPFFDQQCWAHFHQYANSGANFSISASPNFETLQTFSFSLILGLNCKAQIYLGVL